MLIQFECSIKILWNKAAQEVICKWRWKFWAPPNLKPLLVNFARLETALRYYACMYYVYTKSANLKPYSDQFCRNSLSPSSNYHSWKSGITRPCYRLLMGFADNQINRSSCFGFMCTHIPAWGFSMKMGWRKKHSSMSNRRREMGSQLKIQNTASL